MGDAAPEPAQADAEQHATNGDATKKTGRSAPVLPWMRVPLTIHPGDGTILEEVGGLDARLVKALHATSIDVLFPVQSVVWDATAGGSSQLHDICLAAPTGSGKTLAYGLPIIQALSGRCIPHLQALIVLPTRDLAMQVYSVLSPLCAAVGLSCTAACGNASVATEAEILSTGAVDVVIATPGRLMAHLEGTPGMTLDRLRFLVVDEADRLLRQTYQNWLQKVLVAAAGGAAVIGGAVSGRAEHQHQQQQHKQQTRVVKFVVSATLTRDPSKMDRLELTYPRYVAMTAEDHRYKLPPGLQESKIVIPAELKPAALTALLADLRPAPTVVFTSSVQSTRRLALVLRSLSHLVGEAVEYSAAMQPRARRAALEAFRSGAASILVCSDAMTRGMDVDGVEVVVNYDAPVYAKTYVHRAGRTARAGRSGRVITLLRPEDVRHFKGILRKADNSFVKDEKVEREKVAGVKEDVAKALEAMGEALAGEGGDSGSGDAVGIIEHTVLAEGEQGKNKKEKEHNTSAKHAKRRKLHNVPEILL